MCVDEGCVMGFGCVVMWRARLDTGRHKGRCGRVYMVAVSVLGEGSGGC